MVNQLRKLGSLSEKDNFKIDNIFSLKGVSEKKKFLNEFFEIVNLKLISE